MSLFNKLLYFLIVFLMIACNQVATQSEKSSVTMKDTVKTNAELAVKSESLLDTNFMHLLIYLRREGYNLNEGKYPFTSMPYYLDSINSICVVEYKITDVANWYDIKISLTERNADRYAIASTTKDFIALLQNAKSVKGISYGKSEMYVEQWQMHHADNAAIAKQLFEGSKFLFPNTLSFAINVADKFYVFHARYNRPSWTSKKHFQWFVESVNAN